MRRLVPFLWPALLLAAAFPEVLFGGRTLRTSGNLPSIYPAGWAQEPDPGTGPVVLDPSASAWADEPWFHLVHRAFRDGELPLWNPASACGAPLLGDMLSAPFQPLAPVLHLLPDSIRWDAFRLLRLLVAGGFAHLFLARLGLGPAARLLGAAATTLAGHLVLYLDVNHTSVTILQPAMLWAAERMVRTGRAGAVVAVTAAVSLGGMPEPAAFVLLTGGLWFLLRTRSPRLLLRAALAGAAGLLLTAPFVLPFVEFLGEATSFHHDGEPLGLYTRPPANLVTILDPTAFRFAGGDWRRMLVPEHREPYAGFLVAFLAVVGLFHGARGFRGVRIACAALAAFFLLKVFGAPFVQWVGRLPVLRLCIFHQYLFPAFALALVTLAALGAGALRPRHALWLLPLAAFPLVVRRVPPELSPGLVVGGPWPFLAAPALALAVALLQRRWSGAAVVAVAAELLFCVPHGWPLRRAEPPRAPFLDAVGPEGRVFAEDRHLVPNWAAALGRDDVRVLDAMTVRRFRDFVRATVEPGMWSDRWMGGMNGERAHQDPLDRWMRFLGVRWLVTAAKPALGARAERFFRAPPAALVHDTIGWPAPGEARFAFCGEAVALRFDAATSGDAVFEVVARPPAPRRELFRETIDPKARPEHRGWHERRVDLAPWRGREVALRLETGPLASTAFDWAGFLDPRLGGAPLAPERFLAAGAVGAEGPAYATAGAAEGLPLLFLHPPARAELTVRVPEDRPELTFRIGLAPEASRPGQGDGVEFAVAVAPVTAEEVLWRGAGDARVELPGGPVTLVFRARGAAGGVAILGLRLDPDPLVPVFTGGPLVYRNDAALPRAFVVHRAEVAGGAADGLRRLAEPDFDPARTVLLYDEKGSGAFSAAEKGPDPFSSRARVVHAGRHEVVVEAEAAARGWLVLTDVHYPGWSATVDGRDVEVRVANHAFRAVPLEAGRHEVRFAYTCRPWWIGVAIASVTALALVAARLRR
jgi:hypothetical protein